MAYSLPSQTVFGPDTSGKSLEEPSTKPGPLSEELKQCLSSICNHFELEDLATRERQLRLLRRLKYYWDGFQHVWWSETAHNWKVYDQKDGDMYSEYYDKPINVFRAYLESIVAALSVTVPPIKCTPDDAENPLDITTAKSGDKIAELVYRHNDAPLLWIHALYIYCTEGTVAGYNYSDESYKYGSYTENKYEDTIEDVPVQLCSNCGVNMAEPGEQDQLNEQFQPDDSDVEHQAALDAGMKFCPQCQQMVFPQDDIETKSVTRLIGTTNRPKSRQCIEVYGGLNVKFQHYAKSQKEMSYVRLAHEVHFSEAIARYPQLIQDDGTYRVDPGGFSGYD